eukprot:6367814-Pyramimonas_sp.AAC.1
MASREFVRDVAVRALAVAGTGMPRKHRLLGFHPGAGLQSSCTGPTVPGLRQVEEPAEVEMLLLFPRGGGNASVIPTWR